MPTFDSDFDVAYGPEMYVGRGFHLLEGKVAYASPFVPGSCKLVDRSLVSTFAKTSFKHIMNSSDLESQIENSVNVQAPVQGVPVNVNASYLGSLKINSENIATILECSYNEEPRYYSSTPVFTEEAKDLLHADPNLFSQRFGEYFVAGYTERSWLTCVAKHTSSSEDNLKKFAADVTAGFVDEDSDSSQVEVQEKVEEDEKSSSKSDESRLTKKKTPVKIGSKVATAISHASKTHSVSTSIEVLHSGITGILGVFSMDKVVGLFNEFADMQKNQPRPIIVHLRHFGAIDKAARDVDEAFIKGASMTLTEAYKTIFKLHNRILASRYQEIGTLNTKAKTLSDKLARIATSQVGTNELKTPLEGWQSEVQVLESEVEKRELRRSWFKGKLEVMSLEGDQGWKRLYNSEYGCPSCEPYRWNYGVYDPSMLPEPIRGDLASEEAHWRPEYNVFASQKDYKAVNASSRFIVGYQVLSHWHDDTNGWWRLESASPKHVRVHFEGKYGRGADWSLIAWTVPEELYQTV